MNPTTVAIRTRCADVLRDLSETQQGVSKEWKNVQPCVAHAAQLLLQQAQQHEDRLAALEAKMDQVLQAVEVIASDCRLKEQRYQMDRATTVSALDSVQRSAQQLREATDAHQRETRQFHEETLFPGLADLQRQVDALAAGDGHRRRRSPQNAALREMTREVRQLRALWDQREQRGGPPPSPPLAPSSLAPSSLAPPTALPSGPPLGPSLGRVDRCVARWRWAGGPVAAERPIAWAALLLRDTATGDWRPTAATAGPDAAEQQSPLPVRWRPARPAAVAIARDGLYRVAVCLLGAGGPGRRAPSAALRVNGGAVLSLAAGGATHYAMRGWRCAAHERRPAAAKCAACGEGAEGGGGGVAVAAASFADYMRLPAGATLAVHCHDADAAGETYEALLEIEFVAD